MSNIITVAFAEGQIEAVAAEALEQWAYGQKLKFVGLELPANYQVDFSNWEFCGDSIPRIGDTDGVSVPTEVLTSGRNVYAFVWIQTAGAGRRPYRATIRVIPGPMPDPGTPSPEEESALAQAIEALNEHGEDAEAWAVGERNGAPVEENDPAYHNNAKWYAEQQGHGIPAGGTSGQVLKKESDADYDVEWADEEGGGTIWTDDAVSTLISILQDGVYGSADTYNTLIPRLNHLLGGDTVHCTGITLDKETLSLHEAATYTLTATASPAGCTDEIEWSSSDSSVATVEDGVVTGVAEGTATITATCGNYSASCTVSVVEVITYTVTYALTNVTSSSEVSRVEENDPYSTVLSIGAGYNMDSVAITMGGVDVTSTVYASATGDVLIQQVTGNVVITASASQPVAITDVHTSKNTTDTPVYSDAGSTLIKHQYYNFGYFATTHTLTQDGSFTVVITNNTENDVDISGLYVGELPVRDIPNQGYSNVPLWNCEFIGNLSNTLSAGASITKTWKAHAGRRPAVSCKYASFADLDISLSGSYVYEDFDGWSKIYGGTWARGNQTVDGSYTPRAWYRGADDTTTLIETKNGYVPITEDWTFDNTKTYEFAVRLPADGYNALKTNIGFRGADGTNNVYNCSKGLLPSADYWESIWQVSDIEGYLCRDQDYNVVIAEANAILYREVTVE